jgi:CoA:oxalate CoA-transferase
VRETSIAQPSAPLHGVVVIDFSELLPGPFFTQSLVELGATVIRIERPPHGDRLSVLAPAVFTSVNRGKQRFMVDLRSEAGLARVQEWLARADVLVESYRPGVLGRYRLDYATLHARHPRLIYVSLSGYGQEGVDADLPGHDVNYLAAAGVLALAGDPHGPPQAAAGVPMADLCGASYGLSALLAALYQRERTGQGQHLDVALAEAPLHWLNGRLAAMREGGQHGMVAQRAALARAAYGVFACRDERYISIAALEDHFWANLAGVLDMGSFAGPAYAAASARRAAAVQINDVLAARVLEHDAAPLLDRLVQADVPAMLVRDLDTLHAEPHFVSRGVFQETDAGPLCRFPVRLNGMVSPPGGAEVLKTAGEPVFPGMAAP